MSVWKTTRGKMESTHGRKSESLSRNVDLGGHGRGLFGQGSDAWYVMTAESPQRDGCCHQAHNV